MSQIPCVTVDELRALARNASQGRDRAPEAQADDWARMGVALDAVGVSAGAVMTLLRSGVPADDVVDFVVGRTIVEDEGVPMLKENHRKQLEDVAAGRRTVQSLMAAQRADMEGFAFSSNPASEFGTEGWDHLSESDSVPTRPGS